MIEWVLFKEIEGFPAYMIGRNGSVINSEGKPLATQISNSGYVLVHLHNKGKRKACTVHRLVATHWKENPDNLPQVNHKDGNKLNNNDWNLEWSTQSNNMKHAFRSGLNENAREAARERMRALGTRTWHVNVQRLIDGNIARRKPVIQMDLDGNDLREFESVRAARNETNDSNINKVLNGTFKQSKGYKWRWKDCA